MGDSSPMSIWSSSVSSSTSLPRVIGPVFFLCRSFCFLLTLLPVSLNPSSASPSSTTLPLNLTPPLSLTAPGKGVSPSPPDVIMGWVSTDGSSTRPALSFLSMTMLSRSPRGGADLALGVLRLLIGEPTLAEGPFDEMRRADLGGDMTLPGCFLTGASSSSRSSCPEPFLLSLVMSSRPLLPERDPTRDAPRDAAKLLILDNKLPFSLSSWTLALSLSTIRSLLLRPRWSLCLSLSS
mmetsp:Transcript_48494/g.121383  ORF Transcript_48494/g.121383 Transcript_48494/m.121383 type:complete len:237 (+) Transcript_48494:878-1588(+)